MRAVARAARIARTQKSKKRMALAQGIMLTSMLDILTTILFFLLQNFSASVSQFSLASDIRLPQSNAMTPPPGSVLQLVVTKKEILLDDKPLIQLVNGQIKPADMWRDGATITKLAQAFQAHKKRSQFVEKHNDQHSFTGLIVLQADKEAKFELLKRVLYTAGQTDFVNLKLAVLKNEI